jgi:3-hydroxyisobutyrate dehydrogenase
MGRHMAASLMRAGFAVVICDRRPETREDEVLAGARWAESPGLAAAGADAVVTSLPGPTQVEQVVLGPDGVLAGIRPGAVYIDMSTSTPRSIRTIASAAAAKGVEVVDAPVAGGVRGARHGTLTIMVGASAAGFAAALPVLRGMGEQIIHVGGVGAGHVAKLVNNMMTIVNAITAMEAMVVGVKAGVDPEKLIEVAKAGTGDSFSLNLFPYVIFKGAFDPAKFALSLAAKDLRLAVEFAEELGVPLHVVPRAARALAEAMSAGLADRDWSSYITLLEEQAHVEVRA